MGINSIGKKTCFIHFIMLLEPFVIGFLRRKNIKKRAILFVNHYGCCDNIIVYYWGYHYTILSNTN